MRNFARQHPVLTYWSIATFLVALLVPIMLVLLELYPATLDEVMQNADGRLTTNILDAFPHFLGVEGGIPIFLFYVVQPATPLIAAFITASLIGRERLRDLVSRWRFWSKEVGWRRGLYIWSAAIVTMVAIQLGIAGLAYVNRSPNIWPDYSIIANPLSLSFWFLFITSLFFDGGGLLEETGWRGFALPELQKNHSLLRASIGVGVIWSLWHIPIKFDILLSGLTRFVEFYTTFTLHCILLSIVIGYFYNKLGGSTFIAIALHGLDNDSSGLVGFGGIGGSMSLEAWRLSELIGLVPMLVAVFVILWIDKKRGATVNVPEAKLEAVL